jgi:hypothetical protein
LIESSTKKLPSNSDGTTQPFEYLTGTQIFNSKLGVERKMQNFGIEVLDNIMNIIMFPATTFEADN